MKFLKGHKINVGRKHSEEAKRKMSETKKGWHPSKETRRRMSEAKKGKKPPNWGKTPSDETRRKMSETEKGKTISDETRKKMSEAMRGPRGSNWKGGISPESMRIRNGVETHLWREAVFARDNWTCQECGQKGIYLNSHHIKSFAQYPELRFAINNGITFCKECHKKYRNKNKG